MNANVYFLTTVILGSVGLIWHPAGTETTPGEKRPRAAARPLDGPGGRSPRGPGLCSRSKARRRPRRSRRRTEANLLLTGEVKLDATTSPRQLDWINFTGADQQEFPPVLGIYAIEGDRFTVCNGGLNGSRPSEFKPGDGILAEVVVFERRPIACGCEVEGEW